MYGPPFRKKKIYMAKHVSDALWGMPTGELTPKSGRRKLVHYPCGTKSMLCGDPLVNLVDSSQP